MKLKLVTKEVKAKPEKELEIKVSQSENGDIHIEAGMWELLSLKIVDGRLILVRYGSISGPEISVDGRGRITVDEGDE